MSITIAGTLSSALALGPMSGTITVSHPAFTDASSGNFYPAETQEVVVAKNGVYRFSLAPCDNTSPPVFYTAVYHLLNGQTLSEHWIVPTLQTTGSLSIPQIRVNQTVPPPPFLIQTGQLYSATANVGDVLCWSGQQWTPTTVEQSYTFTFTNQSTIVIPAVNHGQGAALLPSVIDSTGNILWPSINVSPVLGDVTINFGLPTSGYGFLTGGLGRSLPNYSKGFIGTNVGIVRQSDHRLNTPNLAVAVYDGNGNLISSSAQISVSPSYDVTVALSTPQNFNVVVLGALGSTVPPNPVITPFSFVTPNGAAISIPAATHGKGVDPLAFFFTADSPAVAADIAYSRDTSGNILATSGFAGTVQVISGGQQGVSAPYTQAISTAVTEIDIPASSHNQGTYPLAFAFTGDTPAVSAEMVYTRDSFGNLAVSFGLPFTGTVQVIAGGWRGSSLYTQTVTAATSVTILATTHAKGQNALASCFTFDNPAVGVEFDWARDVSGTITATFDPPFSGLIQIYSPQ